ELLPEEAVRVLNAVPSARDILPSPESRTFGLATACLAAAVLLPCLAMLDVTRKLARARLCRLRRLSDTVPPATAPAVGAEPPAMPRRPDRREAADVMARAGARAGRA